MVAWHRPRPGPRNKRGREREFRGLRPRCRSEDRRSWTPTGRTGQRSQGFLRQAGTGDGSFAPRWGGRLVAWHRPRPGPRNERGREREFRGLWPRCRSEDRRSWTPTGRAGQRSQGFLCHAGTGDGSFAPLRGGRLVAWHRPRPGPRNERGREREFRGLRPRCRSEDRRSWAPTGRTARRSWTPTGRSGQRSLRPRCRSEDRRSWAPTGRAGRRSRASRSSAPIGDARFLEGPAPAGEQRELRSEHIPVPRPMTPDRPQPELAQRERPVPLRSEVELTLAGREIGPE